MQQRFTPTGYTRVLHTVTVVIATWSKITTNLPDSSTCRSSSTRHFTLSLNNACSDFFWNKTTSVFISTNVLSQFPVHHINESSSVRFATDKPAWASSLPPRRAPRRRTKWSSRRCRSNEQNPSNLQKQWAESPKLNSGFRLESRGRCELTASAAHSRTTNFRLDSKDDNFRLGSTNSD